MTTGSTLTRSRSRTTLNTLYDDVDDNSTPHDNHHSTSSPSNNAPPLISHLSTLSTNSDHSSTESSSSLPPTIIEHQPSQQQEGSNWFGKDVRLYTSSSPDIPVFNADLRKIMEPHIAKARQKRDEHRMKLLQRLQLPEGSDILRPRVLLSTASNAYVPYPAIRHERPFLFDVETFPLHSILATTLGVDDLSTIHQNPIQDKRSLLSPLLSAKKRQAFHECYENFVTSFCIPLLHSLAMKENLFHQFTSSSSSAVLGINHDEICYRYQAFPCLRVIRPGEFSIGPHCDMSYGHSLGNINFHIPLTPTYGTNALYTERHPGREDWHPLETKSVGLGYVFDGARCLHFTFENTTVHTRVSLDFRIAICQAKKKNYYGGDGNNQRRGSLFDTLVKHRRQQSEQEQEEHHTNIDSLHHKRFHSNPIPQHYTADDHIDPTSNICYEKILDDKYSALPGYYDEAYVHVGSVYNRSDTSFSPGPVVYKKNSDRRLLNPDKRVGFPF